MYPELSVDNETYLYFRSYVLEWPHQRFKIIPKFGMLCYRRRAEHREEGEVQLQHTETQNM